MIRIENYDLKAHNTFGMKVKCALYIEYSSIEELQNLDYASLPQPVLHIGGGSNLLFTGDFPGTVLHSGVKYLKYVDMGLDEVLMTVGSGVVFDDFVAETCKNGLWGAENLSLIPGEVGASAVQNIGAYGVEVKDIIAGVVCLDTKDWSKTIFKTHELGYGYRDSMFKHNKGRYIVTSVLFRLTRKYSPKLEYGNIKAALEGADLDALTPQQLRDAIIRIRREKLPDPAETGSAGSFFKNPVMPRAQYEAIAKAEGVEPPHYDLPDGEVKVPAAWMIDRLGFRGAERGGAKVYEKQPLVIVNNSGDAAPADIISLENEIIEGVKERFGVTLSPEVEHI
ncbi:MAG: UDP-N-acetylmuramate dehydrogenase [Bacteroidales bacterium]|nr:UDP-N-acetylmuramate dehydrogenase [Bacteroidales bacterium]